MSWIEIYIGLNFFVIAILILLLFFNKTRLLASVLSASLILFYLGAGVISKIYLPSNDYSIQKIQKFYKENISAVNLAPSSWLQKEDLRGSENIIPLESRQEIGGFFPLGSAAGIDLLYCKEDEGFITYKSDRYGFRNIDSIWNLKKHDILLTGDSFAESACVNIPIQDYFKEGLSIVSLGKGGNGPLISLGTMAEYLNKFDAQKIYHLIYSNDYSRKISNKSLIDIEREKEEIILMDYLHSNKLQGYFTSIDLTLLTNFTKKTSSKRAQQIIESEEKNSFLFAELFSYKLFQLAMKSLYGESIPTESKVRFARKELLINTYRKMNSNAIAKNTKISFVIIPQKASCEDAGKKRDFINNILTKANVEKIDLWDELCDAKLFSINGGHFNSKGYSELAKLIQADFLK